MGQPHFIVFANEKGGTGKSTTAVHTAIALAAAGHRVGALDLDQRQRTMTRYLENRDATMRRLDKQLPYAAYEVLEDQTEAGLDAAIARLAEQADVIVVDTPGRDDPIARSAILKADTLVTPMNDSFVDLDLIGQVHPENFKVTKPSFYAELIWNSRTQRAKETGKSVDWVVLQEPPPAHHVAQFAARRRSAGRTRPPGRLSGHPRPWRARHLPRAVPQGADPARPQRAWRRRAGTHRRPPGVARNDRGTRRSGRGRREGRRGRVTQCRLELFPILECSASR